MIFPPLILRQATLPYLVPISRNSLIPGLLPIVEDLVYDTRDHFFSWSIACTIGLIVLPDFELGERGSWMCEEELGEAIYSEGKEN